MSEIRLKYFSYFITNYVNLEIFVKIVFIFLSFLYASSIDSYFVNHFVSISSFDPLLEAKNVEHYPCCDRHIKNPLLSYHFLKPKELTVKVSLNFMNFTREYFMQYPLLKLF